ncbi:hypothetical protein RvY_09137 [Ramazzottius varieornatus]|uniref:J domain-containing protein n=1 Tax=Ramazzottius varieornatus TaxID=947166 RepID=A0A1D1VDV0_RAMVA|nr:hypothetical protein RvY_09137 [Ramazzottius varieornatus]
MFISSSILSFHFHGQLFPCILLSINPDPVFTRHLCSNHDLIMVIRNLFMWKPAEGALGWPFDTQVRSCRLLNPSSNTISPLLSSKRMLCIRCGSLPRLSVDKKQIRSLHGDSSSPTGCTLYESLGILSNASMKEIKSAFIKKSKELHPDRNPGSKTAHSEFTRVNEAYRILRVPHLRREYDMKLQSQVPQEPVIGEEFRQRSTSTSHVNYRYNPYRDNGFARSSARPAPGHPNYYGIRSWRRVRNRTIFIYCLCVLLLGVGLHFGAYRTSTFLTKIDMDMVQQVNIDRYNRIRQRARETLTSPDDHRYVQSVMESLRADTEDHVRRPVFDLPQEK